MWRFNCMVSGYNFCFSSDHSQHLLILPYRSRLLLRLRLCLLPLCLWVTEGVQWLIWFLCMLVWWSDCCDGGPLSRRRGLDQLIMELTSIRTNELLMGSVYLRLQERDGARGVCVCWGWGVGGVKEGKWKKPLNIYLEKRFWVLSKRWEQRLFW